jgi:hypothetical protein
MTQDPKKSESIEVRVSHQLKQAFMSKAADEGCSASDIVRRSIASYMHDRVADSGTSSWQHVAALGVATIVLFFAYSISSPAAADHHLDFEAAQARLAFDHAGIVERKKLAAEFAEQFGEERVSIPAPSGPQAKHSAFLTLDLDSDGRLSQAEFRELMGVPAGDPGHERFESMDMNHDGWLSEQEFDR